MDGKGKSREVEASSKGTKQRRKRKKSQTSEIDLHDSKQQKKDTKQNETTPEKVLDDSQVHYSAKWSSSSSEPEHEALYMPKFLIAQNFPKNVSKADVKRFFEGKPVQVGLREQNKNQVVGLVAFDSDLDTDEALRLNGKSFRGSPIYVGRNGNNRAILCVRGFNNQTDVDDIERQLNQIFEQRGKVLNIFLPTNSQTGHSLGFAYIYLDHEGKDENIFQPTTMGGAEIQVRDARPKRCFHADMVGKETILKKEDEKTALKRLLLPINRNAPTSNETFSWKKDRPDIIPESYTQLENNCWAVAVTREYFALKRISISGGPTLEVQELEDLVPQAHQVTGRGIDRLKNIIPIMRGKYVKAMNIHQRPRGDNVAQFEDFEKFVVKLLKLSPVMVVIDFLDDYSSFDGKGIYRPSDMDCCMRTFEKFDTHCLLLTGYGVENGVEYWELQDSNGRNWGKRGFIKIERHLCLIKSVVEMKL